MRVRIIISGSRAGALQYLLVRAQVRIYNSRRHVFLFTLLSISTFRARDCSGVMCPGLRFVHNYPIHAHIFVRARICAPYIHRQGGVVLTTFRRGRAKRCRQGARIRKRSSSA